MKKRIVRMKQCPYCKEPFRQKGLGMHMRYCKKRNMHTTFIKPKGILEQSVTKEEICKALGHFDTIHPTYYKGREVMEIINNFSLSFCLGQVVKYVLRARNKNGVEDLKKALWYLEEEIRIASPGSKKEEG